MSAKASKLLAEISGKSKSSDCSKVKVAEMNGGMESGKMGGVPCDNIASASLSLLSLLPLQPLQAGNKVSEYAYF